jgi:hypothetical protein
MNKRAAFSLAALLLAAAPVSATFVTDHGTPFYTTVAEGQAAATKAGTPMIVKFYTDW